MIRPNVHHNVLVLMDGSEKSEAISVEDISYGQEAYKLLSFFIAMTSLY